jgi:uncharacterized membrane protein
MDTVGPLLDALFRWVHVAFGVLWMGLLYFFSFVGGPFIESLDMDSRKAVIRGLMPRASFWATVGGFATYITGLLLLGLIFYHPSGIANVASAVILVVTLIAGPFIYDMLAKSSVAKTPFLFAAIGFVLMAVFLLLMIYWGDFGYRRANIHMGTMLGSILVFNGIFRIKPAQMKVLDALKAGSAPDPSQMALFMQRMRHNAYISLPLLWTMISSHTGVLASGTLGMTEKTWWIGFLVIVLIGWHSVTMLYRRASKLKGV